MAEAQLEESNPVELQLNFDIRLAGQDFVGGGHFPSYETAHYIHRSYHISIPSLSGIDKKDFTGGKPEIDTDDNFNTDYYGTPIYDFEHTDLSSMKIPVLAEGLNWSVKDSNSDSPLVANAKDSFISVPALKAVIDYDTTKYKFDVTGVDLQRVPPLIDPISYDPPTEIVDYSHSEQAAKENEENMEAWKKGELMQYKPPEEIYTGYIYNYNSSYDYPSNSPALSTASITFIGNQDNKNQFHQAEAVFWVRVDDSYAKAHPKEVRKQGYFYYKNDNIGINPLDWYYDPLAPIYSVDDAEYKFNMDDLKDFKNEIGNYVNETYGGFDVPLNIPIIYKWPEYEHVGNNFALNVFVRPKGVL